MIRCCCTSVFLIVNPSASQARRAAVRVLSGLTPPPLADEDRPGHMAGPHGWVDGNAVRSVRVGGGDGAARAPGPGLPPLPLPRLRQAVQRALRHAPEPDAVSVRRHRPRGALAAPLQAEPARP